MRLSYYNGTIEILTPGIPHEIFKKNIAVLVEAFLFDRDIECTPTGSGIREKAGVVALEPDESYVIGDALLAIEINFKINFTSGDASKLERYQALGGRCGVVLGGWRFVVVPFAAPGLRTGGTQPNPRIGWD
jgi:hypothetical protein